MLSVLVCFSSNLSSSGPVFDFRKLCFFCAKPCIIISDERHPDRWEKNPGILCKTAPTHQLIVSPTPPPPPPPPPDLNIVKLLLMIFFVKIFFRNNLNVTYLSL